MATVSACLLGTHRCHLLPSGGSSWFSGGPAPTGGLRLEPGGGSRHPERVPGLCLEAPAPTVGVAASQSSRPRA